MFKMAGLVLKTIVTILVVFSVPFIIPLFLKLLLNWGAFENLEELKEIISILNNKYTLIYICIGITLIGIYFHKWNGFKVVTLDLLKGMKLKFEHGENSLSAELAKAEVHESEKKKEAVSEILDSNKDIDTTVFNQEVRQALGIQGKKNKNTKCNECDKIEIIQENVKLRNFAAYNMLNRDARTALHVIYNENYMKKEEFKSQIIKGYKKRNKKNIKLARQDINKIAQNKYDTIYDGLKFLNIIEPSEDDTIIKLTKEGKEFVEKYIEKEEEVV